MIVGWNSTIHIYYFSGLQVQVRGELAVDDIFAFIGMRGRITTRDIQDVFRVDKRTTKEILNFLIKYDFAKLEGQSVVLSEVCAPFFRQSETSTTHP